MTTIYLSSTYEDLKDYRQVLFDALRKSGHQVIAMEDYVATDQRPVDKCLQDVAEADIYVGIFAFRYGYVPPSAHNNANGLSVTELEFRQAETLKKPCLTFVAKEEAGIPLPMVDAYTGKGEKGEKIKRFRDYLLTEKLASAFSSPHELATLVLAAVTKHQDAIKKTEVSDRQQTETAPAITWDINKDDSPYPGLMHFTRKYASVFFGREAEVREVLDRLRMPEGRFVIISGGSGTGKSSLVDAGVLPRVEEGGIRGERNFVCVRVVPSQGNNPFDAVLRCLHTYAERAGLNVFELAEQTMAEPATLPDRIQEIITKGMNGNGLVLFLDQMEELFTAQNPEVSNKFLAALYEATQKTPLRVITTIRSDHLHHCHSHPEMLRTLRGPGHYPLGPIEPFMLSEMIVKPAKCAGLKIETLARRIVHDIGTEPGNLPLVAFVLHQLFEKRTNHELSEAVYNEMGGVTGAIAQHAATVETAIRNRLGTKAFDLLPKLFQSLVIVKKEGLPTRRRSLVSGFPLEMRKLIDALVQGRLLRTEGEGRDATVSLSHEELFEAWPLLRDYVRLNEKEFIDQTLLESRAKKWADMGTPMFRGLASGWERRQFKRSSLSSPLTREYLNASRRAVCIRTVGVLSTLALVLLMGTWMWKEGATGLYAGSIALARLHIVNVPEPELIDIPGGTFQQGDVDGKGSKSDRPVHEVRLKPFKIGKYEVTFEEYDRYVELTGRRMPQAVLVAGRESRPMSNVLWEKGRGRERRPVVDVSWQEAVAYAKWLSQATGRPYRLPTESEWEYAARDGGKSEIYAGVSDEKQLAEYAVFDGHDEEPVGSRRPNRLGVHDMSGNVMEWVQDCWHNTYNEAPTDGRAWLEKNGGNCDQRVLRGGSALDNKPQSLRSSSRGSLNAGFRGGNFGFRLALDVN